MIVDVKGSLDQPLIVGIVEHHGGMLEDGCYLAGFYAGSEFINGAVPRSLSFPILTFKTALLCIKSCLLFLPETDLLRMDLLPFGAFGFPARKSGLPVFVSGRDDARFL